MVMKRFLFVCLILIGEESIAKPGDPIQWPYYSQEIGYCLNSPTCSTGVTYTNAKTEWKSTLDIISVTKTDVLTMYGIHCDSGNLETGFIRCRWFADPAHMPGLAKPLSCKTTSVDNFVIGYAPNCEANAAGFSGSHSGAEPGGECAVLGKRTSTGDLETPYGILTADMVANSRDTYCRKPVAPSATCNITVENGGIIDHGPQAPTSTSNKSLAITTECGDTPKFTLSATTVNMDSGRIKSSLSIKSSGAPNRYFLTSSLTSSNATGGIHSGSTVLVVSPN